MMNDDWNPETTNSGPPDSPEEIRPSSAPPEPPEGWTPADSHPGAEETAWPDTPPETAGEPVNEGAESAPGSVPEQAITPAPETAPAPQAPFPGTPAQPPQEWPPAPGAYPPAGAYPPPSMEEPPRSKRPLIVALSIIVAVIALAGIGVFAFYDTIMLRINPESYLEKAVDRTTQRFSEPSQLLPDFGKFSGLPTMVELTLQIPELSSYGIMNTPLDDAYFQVVTYSDAARRRAMLEMSFQNSYLQLSGNRIYLSDEMVGVEIPLLMPGYGMITITPETFVSEWNRSAYADYLSQIPLDFNLKEAIEAMFSAMEPAGAGTTLSDELLGDYDQRLAALTQRLQESSSLTYEGEVTLPSGDGNTAYKHFTRVYSAESAEIFIVDMMTLVVEMYEDVLFTSPYSEYLYSDIRTELNYMLETFDELEIKDDVTLHFYVDKSGNWTRLEMPPVDYAIPYYAGGTVWDYSLGMDLQLNGAKNPFDDFSMEITMVDLYLEESVSMALSRSATLEGGVAASTWTLDVDSDDGYSGGTMTLDYRWDQNAVNSENFRASIGYRDRWDEFDLTVTGNLIETASLIQLGDGTFSVSVDGEGFDVDFSFTQKEIDPDELSPERFSTTPLFDISPDELMNTIQNAVFSLMFLM